MINFNTLYFNHFINLSDILFLTFLIFFLVLIGSFFTMKNFKERIFPFGEFFTNLSIFSFFWLIVIRTHMNINDLWIYKSDEINIFHFLFHFSFFSHQFINLLLVFSFLFFIILFQIYKNKLLTTTFEFPLILLASVLANLLILTLMIYFFGLFH